MFELIKKLMQQQFAALKSIGPLFQTKVDRDKIWEVYLVAFEDPVKRQENNCNCCKSFLRQYGGIVWSYPTRCPDYPILLNKSKK